MTKGLIVMSGGMDSATLMYQLLDKGDGVIAASVNYGQRHKKELTCAKTLCHDARVPWKCIEVPRLREILGGSALTSDEIQVPEGHYAEESMKQTVVPNRNMILMSLAAGYAISQKCDYIAYAAHAGDHAIYPDCRKEFADAMSLALSLCDWHSINLYRPYVELGKHDIAKIGEGLGVPYGDTWSCYKGGDLHCGKCGTCVERKEAFELSGVPDPTKYE